MDNNKQKFIFGSLFLLSNKLQVLGDEYLCRDGITTKQWFLTAIISQFKENAPTLSEVAQLMGSSRQNVKQLALKLEEKGYVSIEKDVQDARALRLNLTDNFRVFWESREDQNNHFIQELFKDINEEEICALLNSFHKLFTNIETIEKTLL